MIAHTELVFRIAVGSALGGVIGYERDLHGRPVGLRTHVIVAMAAATFMVISTQLVYFQHYGKEDLVEVDASRIAASVVSGIGFLAGGAILRTGLSVQGLTTAAGLWLVTAIGMSAGSGMYIESGVVTVMGLGALTIFRRLEDKNVVRRRVSVELGEGRAQIDALLAAMKAVGAQISNIDYQHRFDGDSKRVEITMDVLLSDKISVTDLVDAIEKVDQIRRIHVQQRF